VPPICSPNTLRDRDLESARDSIEQSGKSAGLGASNFIGIVSAPKPGYAIRRLVPADETRGIAHLLDIGVAIAGRNKLNHQNTLPLVLPLSECPCCGPRLHRAKREVSGLPGALLVG